MARKIKDEAIQKVVDKINLDNKYDIKSKEVVHFYTYRGNCGNGQFKFVLYVKRYGEFCSHLNIKDFLKNKISYDYNRHSQLEMDLDNGKKVYV